MSNKKVKNEIISLDSAGEVVSFIIFLLTAPVTGAAIVNVIKLMFLAILPKSTFSSKMAYKKKTMRFANPKRSHLTVQRYPEERPDNNVVVDRIFSIIDTMVEGIDWVATKYISVISRILKFLPRFKKMSDSDVKHVAVTVYYTITVGVLMKSIKLLMLKKGLSGDTAAFKSIRDSIANGLKLGSHGLKFDDIERDSDVMFSHKTLAPLVKEFMSELGKRLHFLGEDVNMTYESFEYRDFYIFETTYNKDEYKRREKFVDQYIEDLIASAPGKDRREKLEYVRQHHGDKLKKLNIGSTALSKVSIWGRPDEEPLQSYKSKFTADKYYIRFGDFPKSGRSKNYATGEIEPGVSAYAAKWNLQKGKWEIIEDELSEFGALYSLTYDIVQGDGRPVYLVYGLALPDLGSDGEAVLDSNSVKIVKKLEPHEFFSRELGNNWYMDGQ
jgi:hypothetical protein